MLVVIYCVFKNFLLIIIIFHCKFHVTLKHKVGIKKNPIYRPYNGTGNTVQFPFNFRAVAVLVRFQTVPVLSQVHPVRTGERPEGEIKRAWSLIAQNGLTELERELPSTVIEQQKGSRQFSDRDRARATYLAGYRPPTIAKMLKSEGIFVSRRGVAKFYQEYT